MHPALSVIFFTVLSGAGYGLAFFLALGLGAPDAPATKISWVAALALIGIGLLSSTLHLGNPQRAWRAFSQWRSSWLSREGCMALATFAPLGASAALSVFYGRHVWILGGVSVLFCLLTLYCTAMIYASLRTVAAWHTPLTPAFMFAFAGSSGFALFAALQGGGRVFAALAAGAICAAWAIKYVWTRRLRAVGYGGTTIGSATGLGFLGRVRLLEKPHSMGNYLTEEMVFRLARKRKKILWRLVLAIGLAAPLGLLCLEMAFGANDGAQGAGGVFFPLAALAHICGILGERWLFFAEARHTVALYYGQEDSPQA